MEPRHKIGDKVYVIRDGKIETLEVYSIRLSRDRIVYCLRYDTEGPDEYPYHQDEVFPSPEALAQSLVDEYRKLKTLGENQND